MKIDLAEFEQAAEDVSSFDEVTELAVRTLSTQGVSVAWTPNDHASFWGGVHSYSSVFRDFCENNNFDLDSNQLEDVQVIKDLRSKISALESLEKNLRSQLEVTVESAAERGKLCETLSESVASLQKQLEVEQLHSKSMAEKVAEMRQERRQLAEIACKREEQKNQVVQNYDSLAEKLRVEQLRAAYWFARCMTAEQESAIERIENQRKCAMEAIDRHRRVLGAASKSLDEARLDYTPSGTLQLSREDTEEAEETESEECPESEG